MKNKAGLLRFLIERLAEAEKLYDEAIPWPITDPARAGRMKFYSGMIKGLEIAKKAIYELEEK